MRLPKHILILSSTLVIGCAGGDDGRTEEVTILSKPKGAMVEVNGNRVGRTPITVELDRASNHELVVDKSGFEVKKTVLRPTLRKDTYGFGGKVIVELDAVGTGSELSPEDKTAFDRQREAAKAPMGVDAAIWGTTQGDLAEAKLSARKLAELAAAAKADAGQAEAALAASLAALKEEASKGSAEAEQKLAAAEADLISSDLAYRRAAGLPLIPR